MMITKPPPATSSPRRMTVDEFYEYATSTDNHCELIHGELREMPPPGMRHGKFVMRIGILIGQFVYQNNLGEVFAESGYRLHEEDEPPTVRAPDVAFFRQSRLAEADTSRYAGAPPDLAIEILSPGDVRREVDEKIAWWLDQGTAQVWTVNPESRTVTVHLPDDSPKVYTQADTLVAEPLLPGFELEVSELFA